MLQLRTRGHNDLTLQLCAPLRVRGAWHRASPAAQAAKQHQLPRNHPAARRVSLPIKKEFKLQKTSCDRCDALACRVEP